MLKAFFACMSMFTKLPFPIVSWEEKKGPLALCFLPAAGLCCGLITWLVYYTVSYFNIPDDSAAILLLLSIFVISGFVHLDGFMDSVDSLLSARDKEGKIAILKDSKVGAFSVIAVCLLLISFFASLKTLSLYHVNGLFLLLTPVLSRANGAAALFILKPLSTKGILFYFRDGEKPIHKIMMFIVTIAVLTIFLIIHLYYFIAALIAILISTGFALIAKKELGGINGDIIGAFIIITEAAAYLILSILII